MDQSSLIISIMLIAGALSLSLSAGYLVSRSDRFLLTWAIGLLVIVAGMGLYIGYVSGTSPSLALPAYAFILGGLAIIEAAAFEFRTGSRPWRRAAIGAALAAAVIAPFFLSGISGIGSVLMNLLACTLLCAAAWHYWKARNEAKLLLSVMSGLYSAAGLSFVICAVVIAIETPIVRVAPKESWSEALNSITVIVTMAGIGAISLALNQARLAARLRIDSLTDPLTGLANRRALFSGAPHLNLRAGDAVVVFDLDHFKGINDRYGHSAGDEVLKAFAQRLVKLSGDALAARTGGEEFVVLLRGCSGRQAHGFAETVRSSLAARPVITDGGAISCTLSAGVAIVWAGMRLDDALNEADKALYVAKAHGRNRVSVSGLRRVA